MITNSSILVCFDSFTFQSQFITLGIYCIVYPTNHCNLHYEISYNNDTFSTVSIKTYWFNELVGEITANMIRTDTQIAER